MNIKYCLYLTPVGNSRNGDPELYGVYQDAETALTKRNDKIKASKAIGGWEMWDVVVRTGDEDYGSVFRGVLEE